PIAHGPRHFNAFGRAPQHVIGLMAYRHHLVVAQPDRHHRWLVHDNASALDMHQDVDCAQVDSDVFLEHRPYLSCRSRSTVTQPTFTQRGIFFIFNTISELHQKNYTRNTTCHPKLPGQKTEKNRAPLTEPGSC